MNKLDVDFASSLHLGPAARRLIILIPDFEADTAYTARKIRELANALESRVHFLGLSQDAAHEPGIRRQLVNLSAMVEDKNIPVESKVEIGNNWLNVVKPVWHEGDVIICFAGQRSGFAHKPLNQILVSNLNAMVYVFDSPHQQEKRLHSTWILDAMAWAGSLGIILGFFWLQSILIHSPADWTHTLLFYISLFVEAGLIWAWNSIFG